MIWQEQMETCLEKELKRLLEILEDLGHNAAEFEKNSITVKSILNLQDPEVKSQQLVDQLNFIRIPGYCAYQLTQEAVILLHLMSVKISSLRPIYKESGDSVKLAKLNQYEAAVNQVDPEIRRSIETLALFSTLDSRKIMDSIIASYKKT